MELPRSPSLTKHAAGRAKERLGMDATAFAAWVRATYRHWLQVNADFCHNRNLNVSARNSLLFATPWTPAHGVLLVISNDKLSVKTLMLFDQPSRMAAEVTHGR